MLNKERDQQWQRVLDLTQKMLQAAYHEDWDSLVSFEAQRAKVLTVFFGAPPLPEESQQLRKGISEVMAADKEIYRLSAAAHAQIGEKLSKLACHKNATNAYLKNTG